MSGLADVVPAEALVPPDDAEERLPGYTAEGACWVRPGNADEAGDVLAWATRNGVPVVPIGTGRHQSRGRVPAGCVVLSTERMAAIEIYEPADLTLTAGAGTTLDALEDALAPHDQWLPFDPPYASGRTLGGLVAAGLSGPLATGYGALRNHVLGATAVFGDGRVVRLGGRVVKNVAGFDLLRPLVGSEGSLAVLTSVCVRLFARPEVDRLLVMRSSTTHDLVDAARAVRMAPVTPASAVLARGGPLSAAGVLAVRLNGAAQTVAADTETFERVTGASFEVLEGDEARRLARALADHPRVPAGAHPAVDGGGRDSSPGSPTAVGRANALPSRLAEVLRLVEEAVGEAPLCADAYGGRVRFEWDRARVDALAALRRSLEALGGSLGIEWAAPEFDAATRGAVTVPSERERALEDRVRAVFDPAGVLSPRDRGRARSPETASFGT